MGVSVTWVSSVPYTTPTKMKSDLAISYYQNQWAKWDDMKSFGPMSRLVRQKVLKLIQPHTFSSVLDVGCGVGTLLHDIHQLHPQITLTGTELFPDSLQRAKKRLPQATFTQLDLVKSKLKGKYDLTLCIDVLEHIPNDQQAMKHLAEMTQSYAVIVVPLGPLFAIETERVGHVHGYSRKEFDRRLKKAGFEIIQSEQWGFPFYNLYRRLLHRLPESSTTGNYTWKKKLTGQVLYWLLSLSTDTPWGERYFVLCQPR